MHAIHRVLFLTSDVASVLQLVNAAAPLLLDAHLTLNESNGLTLNGFTENFSVELNRACNEACDSFSWAPGRSSARVAVDLRSLAAFLKTGLAGKDNVSFSLRIWQEDHLERESILVKLFSDTASCELSLTNLVLNEAAQDEGPQAPPDCEVTLPIQQLESVLKQHFAVDSKCDLWVVAGRDKLELHLENKGSLAKGRCKSMLFVQDYVDRHSSEIRKQTHDIQLIRRLSRPFSNSKTGTVTLSLSNGRPMGLSFQRNSLSARFKVLSLPEQEAVAALPPPPVLKRKRPAENKVIGGIKRKRRVATKGRHDLPKLRLPLPNPENEVTRVDPEVIEEPCKRMCIRDKNGSIRRPADHEHPPHHPDPAIKQLMVETHADGCLFGCKV